MENKVIIYDALKAIKNEKEDELPADQAIKFVIGANHFTVKIDGDELAIRKVSNLGDNNIHITPIVGNDIRIN